MTDQTSDKPQRLNTRLWSRVYRLIFLGYITVLAWELFLGKYRSHGGSRRYNLEPLKTIVGYIKNYESFGVSILLINLVGNIVAFMPMGFLLPLVFKRTERLIVIMLIALLTSITAEVCQYIFNVGGLDIDDVLLNTIGGVLGYLIYKLVGTGTKYKK
ncbi:VanZ family protein [Desulfosporosinus fructosivorans]|uniref:VanZ family protein n=1 Tax=Desulfosporosinus fructosivorans TaxID=2018669 RepID=A0A4Z0QZY1_9FIRM|nr:VanZ family protein [Desulfosporosinus fructosivorans]TGE34926.1 VanZ family protein [Desulfosporosinus fructosivorans]